MPKHHLYLIGYRGSGKSTLGPLLAAKLSRPFYDADQILETTAGLTIREIFQTLGESTFRDRESACLQQLAAEPPAVIATGGGVILRPENRALLRDTGRVVWLRASATWLWGRIQQDPRSAASRPNLTAIGGQEEVEQLLAAREPLYRETADLVVLVEGRSPEDILTDILSP